MISFESRPSTAMIAALTDLWRLSAPGPDNLLADPAFLRLRESCRAGYPSCGPTGPNFALSAALRSLGLPCSLSPNAGAIALPVAEAAARLHAGLGASTTQRVHMAPLDLAEQLPEMTFGPARVARLSADALSDLFDAPRLRRVFGPSAFDAQRFAEFHWLIVEETVPLDQEPEARAFPMPFVDLSEDFGRIEPHKGRFPAAVEEALFFLLLVPWENIVRYPDMDWRGFHVPWVHTVDADLFIRPQIVPSPDSLNWEERTVWDVYGQAFEVMAPLGLPLEQQAETELKLLDQALWDVVRQARTTPLFETPIVHFFVRAFLADGIDEVLSHMTAIEAALGLHADYDPAKRVLPDRHKRLNATKRMRGRVAGLLGCGAAAAEYKQLFDVRSAFLHGRPMKAVSSTERLRARSLARRVIEALVLAAQQSAVTTREAFLDTLLDRGLTLL